MIRFCEVIPISPLRASIKFVAQVLIWLVFANTLPAAQQAKLTSRPNIVFILIDDFGYENVTANGGESYQTPVMDRLAATGVRFEQCHVQPLCTPTRVELMTGLSNKRNYANFGLLDPSQKTFGNWLKDAGYATCVAGKWQLGNGWQGPKHFGFDEYALWQLFKKEPRYKNPILEINGKAFTHKKNEYGPDIVSDFVLDFIQRKKDGPFLVYYPMMLTHSPFDATPDSPDYLESEAGSGKGKKGKSGHFPDMVAYTDKLIGKLIDQLDELKVRDNTLVLILGDNGTAKGMPARFQGREVKGGKGMSTTWGTHVPCIGNWPAVLASGKVCRDLISSVDVLPTLCEAAGVTIPTDTKIDGRSFLPQLRGERGAPRDWLYCWYNPAGGKRAHYEFAQDDRYKLYTDGRFFDVRGDDRELNPLSSLTEEAQQAKSKLQAALEQFAGPRPEYFAKQQKPNREADDPSDNGYGLDDEGRIEDKKNQ